MGKSMGNSPGPKKERWGAKGQLPIFEFESVFFSLGRSRTFDLKVFFMVVHLGKCRPLYPAVKPLVPP